MDSIYKYYFRKPKSEIAKDFLSALLVGGVIVFAASSPIFAQKVWKNLWKKKTYPRKRVYDTFYQFRKYGLVHTERRGKQLFISLTDKGKQKAGMLQIDALRIDKPKKWDGKWRVLIFDIGEKRKAYREAFRGKLMELGFIQLQKSVWMCPYPCSGEVEILRRFFGMPEKELRLLLVEDIGNDQEFRRMFVIT